MINEVVLTGSEIVEMVKSVAWFGVLITFIIVFFGGCSSSKKNKK